MQEYLRERDPLPLANEQSKPYEKTPLQIRLSFVERYMQLIFPAAFFTLEKQPDGHLAIYSGTGIKPFVEPEKYLLHRIRVTAKDAQFITSPIPARLPRGTRASDIFAQLAQANAAADAALHDTDFIA